MLTCVSRAFNCGSPNISHQSPRILSSCGAACFHSPFSLKFAGGGSLKAGGMGAAGVLYFGPTEQAESRQRHKNHERSRSEDFEIGRILHLMPHLARVPAIAGRV